MAWALGANLGTQNQASGTTIAVTVTASPGIGALVVVSIGSRLATNLPSSVTDSKGNTYTQVVASGTKNSLWASVLGTALVSGIDIITGNGLQSAPHSLIAASWTGGPAGAATNAYGTNNAAPASATPTVATSASVAANDLCVATIADGIDTITDAGAPWNAINSITGNSVPLNGSYQIPGGAGTLTYNPTKSATSACNLVIAAFPLTIVSASTPTRALLGVGQ